MILVLKRLRQEDCVFKARGYIVTSCLKSERGEKKKTKKKHCIKAWLWEGKPRAM